jgi:hypothetical protein
VERKKREREKRRKRKEGFDVKHGIFVLRRRKCVIGFYEMVLGLCFFLRLPQSFWFSIEEQKKRMGGREERERVVGAL